MRCNGFKNLQCTFEFKHGKMNTEERTELSSIIHSFTIPYFNNIFLYVKLYDIDYID